MRRTWALEECGGQQDILFIVEIIFKLNPTHSSKTLLYTYHRYDRTRVVECPRLLSHLLTILRRRTFRHRTPARDHVAA